MNTKRRLSDDLSNDSEILSEKRFVKLYKEELESIEKQIHDLKKLDQKDFDVKPEVEDKARLYYRHLQENFMMFVKEESVMKSFLIFGNAKKN